jgi:gas vesicle protein GvpL/GvpF
MPDPLAGSGCYVYGIVAAERIPDEECLGVSDARLDYVRNGHLAAAVSELDDDRRVSLRADLTAHTRVLDWLAARTTVIPMAFGTVTEDSAAVVDSVIVPGAEMLLDMLQWLEGTSQFNLRGIYHREQVLSEVVLEDPGLRELHRRTRGLPQGQPMPELIRLGEGVSAALDRRKADDSQRILEAVAPFVVDLRDRVSGDMDQVFDIAILIPQAQRERVESTLEEIAEAEHERIRLQLTGPFPPYDFVRAMPWVS